METPTIDDMRTTLDDARFFCTQMEPLIRGPEHEQELEQIRRYFRAYLHCWKCVLDFIGEAKGWKAKRVAQWCEGVLSPDDPQDRIVFDYLWGSRNHDTHTGTITVSGEIAAGLFPIIMFEPKKWDPVLKRRVSDPPKELISCCEHGLDIGKRLIGRYESEFVR